MLVDGGVTFGSLILRQGRGIQNIRLQILTKRCLDISCSHRFMLYLVYIQIPHITIGNALGMLFWYPYVIYQYD